jgi:hypothetical protein
MALIERELKRTKLVAKYAKKHAQLKAIATDAKQSGWNCKSCRATPTPRGNATVAPSLAARAARFSTLAWHAQRSAKWLLPGRFLASPKPAGKRQEA